MLRRQGLPFIGIFVAAVALGAAKPTNDIAAYVKENTKAKHLIVLASSHDFPAIKRLAQSIGRKVHMPFSMGGRIFDSKRGIIVPDNDPDVMWAGSYFLRRNNTDFDIERPFLSIEESDAYPGLKPGYYILVAGIYDTHHEAAKAAVSLRHTFPDLMIRRTTIYMGCMH